jgi:hypothetical protein
MAGAAAAGPSQDIKYFIIIALFNLKYNPSY